MKLRPWLIFCLAGSAVILFAVALWTLFPTYEGPATEVKGKSLPLLSQNSPPQPISPDLAQSRTSIQDGGKTRKKSLSSLPLRIINSEGHVITVDLKSPEAPGFIETKSGGHYRVQLPWPHQDKEVWATRMDGGTFDRDNGKLLKIPVQNGELKFGFTTGPEPGRYQIEIAGASGAVEHIAFWADPPNLPVEPSGTTFVEPPLRTNLSSQALNR